MGRVVEAVRTVARACTLFAVIAWVWLRVRLRRGTREDEIYRAVVRLGPTAIKLAQVASTRPDLVPASVSRRLESLQEAAPRFPWEAARQVVEDELGAPLEARFATFPPEPIASASLSQVYFATLLDATPVAVKVQRPGIALRIARDVRILRALARAVTLVRPRLRNLRLADAVAEFGRWTLRELDFRLEGENADELRRNFAAWPDVHLPTIHGSHTTARVLTMERVAGRRVKDLLATMDDGARLAMVRHLAELVMKMFVDDGLFHADLHPGNIFFPDDGSIVLLDVGMVGRMNRRQADRFLAYWMAVGRRQRDRAFHHLMALAIESKRADLVAYRAAYERILDAFDGSSVEEQSLARTYLDVVQAGARHGVVFPSEMLLQAKALVTMEALCLVLAPGFRFSDEMRPIVARRLAARFTPEALLDRLWLALPDLVLTGELLAGARHPRDHEAEPAFRRDAAIALTERWIDAADAWLAGLHLPAEADRPHLAALVDLVTGGTLPPRRPWLDAAPAAVLPLARIALARAEAAVREAAESPTRSGPRNDTELPERVPDRREEQESSHRLRDSPSR